ncbi:hypothetical protein H5185_04920 [Shewanella sp. SG44-6]|jgi:hypothetical protein|uniref:hypothetical protein n=1 Tax=Shewanella sp. SG44-6 TaxID=2760959 RepID=UPI0016018D58|nr:hypothetical protein [Shewanella sp. SG44-6]MBB1388766.1 hypothetical protein [Shewanella sp. SG44-6]
MAKVFDKHIRISNKRYRLHAHLSKLPTEAVRDEMLTLMEIGLAMLNNSIKNNINLNDNSVPSSENLQSESSDASKIREEPVKEEKVDEFDISDAMFEVYD